MDENQVVNAQAEPAAEPQVSPAGDAHDDGVQEMDIADVMAGKTPETAAKPAEPQPETESEEPSKAPEKPYRTQQDVDTAIGRRLASERKKFEPDRRLAAMVREANAGMSDEQIADMLLGMAGESLGFTPEQAKFFHQRGLLGGSVEDAQDEPSDPWEGIDRDEAAVRMAEQADEVAAVLPEFNWEKFLEDNMERMPQLARGDIRVAELALQQVVPQLLQRAREEGIAEGRNQTIQNIQTRNARTPTPSNPGTPAIINRDYANMSSEEFMELAKRARQAAESGVRVKL